MRNQIEILSVPIDVVTMDEAMDRVEQMLRSPGFHFVATMNAEMVMLAKRDKVFADLIKGADLVLPDGAGVLWAAEQQNEHFPERVTGVDTAKRLFEKAAKEQLPIYCLGGESGVAEDAVAAMEKEFGPLSVVGVHSGFFTAEEEKEIIKKIEEGGTKIVLVALGVPRQEIWITQNLSHLSGVVGMGVGGTFDVLAGRLPRAPKWMQDNRLEWLFRLYKQPWRIKRMMALPQYVWAVWKNKK